MRTRHHLLLAAVAAALLVPLGCQQEGIETHRVPHQEPPPPPEDKLQLLGAMVPHGGHTWFFKLLGPIDRVEKQRDAFDQLVNSVKFKGADDVEWKLPDGWERGPDRRDLPDRYATLRTGPGDQGPELTVIRLGDEPKTRSAPDNVNRWRGQLGLKPLADADVEAATRLIDVDGEKAVLVDMKGPGGRGQGPPFAGGMPAGHPPVDAKLGYKAPEGWTKVEPPVIKGFRYEVVFRVKDGDKEAVATISKFPGEGGGALLNVNRWRGQIGLRNLDAEQLADAARIVPVGGGDALAVDMTGPGGPADKGKQRTLAVIVRRQREGQTWFLKMQGPADLVGKQQAAFDKFVGSVTFDGGNGG